MSTNGAKVLHFQKVAGISGSEAHLLSLLPRLAERGWDVRMLMLHENEPGAWDFARELEGRGVPLDAIPIARDFDPAAFMRLVNYVGRERPTILHTHLVHADAYGQIAGALAGVPVRVSTKHGFNEFREGRAFALADRGVASLATSTSPSRAASRSTSSRQRASTPRTSRSSTTASRRAASRRRTPSRRRGCSASAG